METAILDRLTAEKAPTGEKGSWAISPSLSKSPCFRLLKAGGSHVIQEAMNGYKPEKGAFPTPICQLFRFMAANLSLTHRVTAASPCGGYNAWRVSPSHPQRPSPWFPCAAHIFLSLAHAVRLFSTLSSKRPRFLCFTRNRGVGIDL